MEAGLLVVLAAGLTGPFFTASPTDQALQEIEGSSERLDALYGAIQLEDPEEQAQALLAALELPAKWTEASRTESYWEAYARIVLVEHFRRRLDFASAHVQCAALDQRAAFLRRTWGAELDPEEQELVVHAELVSIQVDLELGRIELASRRLRELRKSLGDQPVPGAYVLVANQYNLMSGRYAQVCELQEEGYDIDERRVSKRHLVLAQLLDARANVRRGKSAWTGAKQVLETANAYLQSEDLDPESVVRVSAAGSRLAIESGLVAMAEALTSAGRSALDASATNFRPSIGLEIEQALSEAELSFETEQAVDAELIEDSWERLVASWAANPALQGGAGLFVAPQRRDLLCRTLDLVLRTRGADDAYRILARARALASTEQVLGAAPVELATAASWLGQRSAGALEWVSGDSLTLVCAVDDRGARWFELDPVTMHSLAIETLSQALVEQQSGQAETQQAKLAADELAAAFLPQALCDWIEPWESLLICGRDWLNDLDFEALPTPKAGLLGLHKVVGYAPSLAAAHALDLRDQGATSVSLDRAVVLCGTDLTYESAGVGRVQPIPHPKLLQAGLVASWIPQTAFLVGSKARLDAIEKHDPHLLTIFAHGVLDATRWVPAGVLLGGPSKETGTIAWWEDFRALRAARICVLLTCRASAGFDRLGDGGYTRVPNALLMGGASAVLCSARDLDAERAVLIHQAWLAALAERGSIGASLLQAKRTLAAAGSSPRAWATLLEIRGLPWLSVAADND